MSDIKRKVLLIDDELSVLNGLVRNLRGAFTIVTLENPLQAEEVIKANPDIAVVVSDMRMSARSGVETLKAIADLRPDIIRVMLTGNADQETASQAINTGQIFRFLNKPCAPATLKQTIYDSLRQFDLDFAERELLTKTLGGSIRAITELMGLLYPEMLHQGAELRRVCSKIAAQIKIDNGWELEIAASLWPFSLVLRPESIRKKIELGRPLTKEEQGTMDTLPAMIAGVLTHIPRLQGVAQLLKELHRPTTDSIRVEILKQAIEFISLGGTEIAISRMRANSSNKLTVTNLLELCLTKKPEQTTPQDAVTITINELIPGQILQAPVFAQDGRLLFAAPSMITASAIDRIKNFSTLFGLRDSNFAVDTKMPTRDAL